MKAINWSNPLTWMLTGVLVVIVGAVIGSLGGDGEAGNPVIAVGVLFFLIGAFTAAIRRGVEKNRRQN